MLEIGPASVRVASGPGGPVDPRLAEAALCWIDDPVGLYNERPVAVADLWRSVMVAAAGGNSVVLVHPDDWTSQRVARVVAAANAVADEVVAVARRNWNGAIDGDGDGDGDGGQNARPGRPRRRRLRRAVPLALATGAVASIAGWSIIVRPPAMQTVVEGRIAVQVPAGWTVTRVTGGPGSRRLRAAAPADPDLALHFTQSYAPESTLDRAGDVLRRVIADQPTGVFVDLRVDGRVGGRPAVTYREIRTGRIVDWSVVLVGSTLIGVGCQSPPQRAEAVSAVCRQAVAAVSESRTDPF